MILLLGSDSITGRAFCDELRATAVECVAVPSAQRDLADLHVLYDLVRRTNPSLLICATSATWPSAAAADRQTRELLLYSNVLVPQTVAQACRMRKVPWARVSCGTMFRGALVPQDGQWVPHLDLSKSSTKQFLKRPARLRGFCESDEPNNCFSCPPCDFLSGSAALGEHAITQSGHPGYIWRHGVLLGFAGEEDSLNHQPRKASRIASASFLPEFARACLQLWNRHAAFGIYNVVNPGPVNLAEFEGTACGNGDIPPNKVSVIGPFVDHDFVLDDRKLRSASIHLTPTSQLARSSQNDNSNGSDKTLEPINRAA